MFCFVLVIFVVSTWDVVRRLKRDYGSIEEITRRIGTTTEKGASFAFIVGNMRSATADHRSMAKYIESTVPLDESSRENEAPKKYKRQRTQSAKFREMDIKITNQKSIKNAKIAKKLKLHQILSKDESFELFIQHLSKEYNNERCLLCFIEFVQFKQLLFNNLSDIAAGTFGSGKLAPTIPKSVIVYTGEFNTNMARNPSNPSDLLLANAMVANNSSNHSYNPNSGRNFSSMSNNMTRNQHSNRSSRKNNENPARRHQSKMTEKQLKAEYKCRAYLLYQKYIKADAEFEIEFDGNSVKAMEYKEKIVREMDELDNWLNNDITNDDLFHQFDTVIHEMYKIMFHSYQSFLTTDVCCLFLSCQHCSKC